MDADTQARNHLSPRGLVGLVNAPDDYGNSNKSKLILGEGMENLRPQGNQPPLG